MIRTLSRVSALLATLVLAAPHSRAQCAPPDGLDGGPCCSSAQLLVPRPKFQQASLGICWQNCNVAATTNYNAVWSGLMPGIGSGGVAPCGWFQARLSLYAGASLAWSGAMQLSYDRTWVETSPAGTNYHVWRFLVNGDLTPTAAAGPIPCPVPPCVPAFNNRARYTGYVDYAFECGTNTWRNAWMLTHACDSIDHAAGFPRGGAFHPDRVYSFVGPAAGFVIAALQPVETGGTGVENIRGWKVPPPGAAGPVVCETEERLLNCFINPVTQLCQCVNGPGQYVHSDLFVSGACGTVIATPTGSPDFISMGIGGWTNPLVYPGQERLRWTAGTYVYTDGCNGATQTEFFFGVSTFQGWTAHQYLSTGIGPTLPSTFVDQCNSKRFPGGTPIRNVPFQSDHVFSLNLP